METVHGAIIRARAKTGIGHAAIAYLTPDRIPCQVSVTGLGNRPVGAHSCAPAAADGMSRLPCMAISHVVSTAY